MAWNPAVWNAGRMKSNLRAEDQGGPLWSGELAMEVCAAELGRVCFAGEVPTQKSLSCASEFGERMAPCKCRAVFTSLTHPRFVYQRVGPTLRNSHCFPFLTVTGLTPQECFFKLENRISRSAHSRGTGMWIIPSSGKSPKSQRISLGMGDGE